MDREGSLCGAITAFTCGMAICAAIIMTQSCAFAERTVIKAADVVNEVAHRGDQLDAVAVESCHAAEEAAVEHPDLDEAERLVGEIRAKCDAAFEAIDEVERAIATVDEVFASVERGQTELEELVAAAIAARQAFEKAQGAHDALRTYLETVK